MEFLGRMGRVCEDRRNRDHAQIGMELVQEVLFWLESRHLGRLSFQVNVSGSGSGGASSGGQVLH